MGHLYHGYVSHNQRVPAFHQLNQLISSTQPPDRLQLNQDVTFPETWRPMVVKRITSSSLVFFLRAVPSGKITKIWKSIEFPFGKQKDLEMVDFPYLPKFLLEVTSFGAHPIDL